MQSLFDVQVSILLKNEDEISTPKSTKNDAIYTFYFPSGHVYYPGPLDWGP